MYGRTTAVAGVTLLTLFVSGSLIARYTSVGVPDSGVELGLGWDSQRARIVPNRCIEFAPVQEQEQNRELKSAGEI